MHIDFFYSTLGKKKKNTPPKIKVPSDNMLKHLIFVLLYYNFSNWLLGFFVIFQKYLSRKLIGPLFSADKLATAVLYKYNFPVFRTIVFHDTQSALWLSNNLQKETKELKIRLHGDKKM